MKGTHLALRIGGLPSSAGEARSLYLPAPSTWEREATSGIKAGDYEDAMKIAKRGLVEEPVFGVFRGSSWPPWPWMAARRMVDWSRATVLNEPERFPGDLNTIGFLSKNTTL